MTDDEEFAEFANAHVERLRTTARAVDDLRFAEAEAAVGGDTA